jgi:peptidoglycan/xylan/chitin deacetylase (PgdA/CDA1 family)
MSLPEDHLPPSVLEQRDSSAANWTRADGGLYRSYLRQRKSGRGPLLAKALYWSGLASVPRNLARGYEIQVDPEKWLPSLRKAPQPKFLILCYHRVGLGGVPLYSELAPDLFEAQMRFLKSHYRVLPLDDVCRELKDPTSCEPGVAITFDDGYRDLYQHAFPVLRKYQIPATVYLIAQSMESGTVGWYDRVFLALQLLPNGRLDIELDSARFYQLSSPLSRFEAALQIIGHLRSLPNFRRKECCADLENRVALPQTELRARILDWDQVRKMQDEGVSFGSHTFTHPVVSRLSPAELPLELVDSKRELEAGLSRAVRHFAFPFGRAEEVSSEAIDVLAQSQFISAVTTIPGVNLPSANPFALRRVQIGEEHDLPMFAHTLNQFFLLGDGKRTEQIRQAPSLRLANAPPVDSYPLKDTRRA